MKTAQYMEVRENLLKIIVEVSCQLNMSHDVVHLAAMYLDRLNADYPWCKARLLAALACMMVAAKFLQVCINDEGKSTIPSYSYVLAKLKNPVNITTKHLVAWERRVLAILNWRLSSATVSNILDAYRALLTSSVFGPDY